MGVIPSQGALSKKNPVLTGPVSGPLGKWKRLEGFQFKYSRDISARTENDLKNPLAS